MSEGAVNSAKSRNIFEPIQVVESDHLGRLAFARQILDRVSDPDCPSVLGLYGGWGTGKTSILNLIQYINTQEANSNIKAPHLEYIDVWPYEVSGDLAVPLLIRIRNLIGEPLPSHFIKSWRRILGVLIQAGTDIFLRKLIALDLKDVKGYVENLSNVAPSDTNIRDLETLIDNIQGAQNAFQELVILAQSKHQNRGIVFLIDNLDRCSPENVVHLLESIKNFLYASNCTWIFAMDSGVISSYIDRKYENTKMDGNSYLDKIIPEQYHIPPITGLDMHSLQRFVSVAHPANRPGLPEINLSKIPQLPEVLVPRRLLKTSHRFYRAYITSNMSAPADADMIFALILLYNSWPSFYERFSSEAPDHVRGILANFIPNEKDKPHLIPLPQNILDDRSLVHYINHYFINGQNIDDIKHVLAQGMEWLRKAGLP
jgi:hypothetical protein